MSSQTVSASLSNWIFLAFIVGIPLIAMLRKVDIFGVFLDGAKDGVQLAIKIIPPIVAILVAIGMFRAAGGFDLLAEILGPILDKIGFPHELLPLALVKPFSGGTSNGILAELAHTYGGNSTLAHMGATMAGSTETTFYIVAIYFAAVAIRRTRYAIGVGLFADFVGIVASVFVVRLIM